jgi:hypothetical protein
MAATAGGLPYPVGTDKVVNGDDAIKALAQTTDDRLLFAGYLRARAAGPSSGIAAGAWTIMILDDWTETTGVQPWTWTSGGITITKSGVYAIQAVASLTSGGTFLAKVTSGANSLGQAASTAQSFTAGVAAIRQLAAGSVLRLQVFPAGVAACPGDTADAPTYLSIVGLRG